MKVRRFLFLALLLGLIAAPCTARASVAVPTNPHVAATSTTSVTFAWSGAASKYAIWLDGAYVTRIQAHSYTYAGLACGTTHQLGVRSVSWSNVSAIVWVTAQTDACPPPPPPACSAEPFCGDYETGDASQWWLNQWIGGDGCGGACTIDQVGNATGTIITSPVAQGGHALECVVASTGGGTSLKNRCEVVASQAQTGGTDGQEWYYSWYTMFPGPSQSWWSGGADFNDIAQFFDQTHQAAWILIGVDATSGHPTIYIDGPMGHRTLADPLTYDHWYHFIVHVVWSANASIGLWQMWLDGAEKIPATHMTTMAGTSVTYAQGFYSKRSTDNTVIVDGFCRAATLADAEAC